MPLDVIIVGAGIAGLCAAISLRQAGHRVQVLEKSTFAAEIGAALALTPNGTRVLENLGFSFERARAIPSRSWDTIDGTSLRQLASVDLSGIQEMCGGDAGFWRVHRVDLHNELLRLATSADDSSGIPVDLRLNSPVSHVTSDGEVVLQDGSTCLADLVVGADGLRSVVRDAVLGPDSVSSPVHSGLVAFRSLVDTECLKTNPALASFMENRLGRSAMLVDSSEGAGEQHMMWYGCRGGEVQNIVGILHSEQTDISEGDDAKTQMRKGFSYFHQDIIGLIDLLENVKIWPLFFHDPLPRWVRGRLVLIGDAAHPMLPFSGQGSNQAMEDGGALGVLLRDVGDSIKIQERLSLFEPLRKNRVSRIQALSKVRGGHEKEVENELRRYVDSPDDVVPTTHRERVIHDCRFDIFAECERALKLNNNVGS